MGELEVDADLEVSTLTVLRQNKKGVSDVVNGSTGLQFSIEINTSSDPDFESVNNIWLELPAGC